EQRQRIVTDSVRKLPFDYPQGLMEGLLMTIESCLDMEESEQSYMIQEWLQQNRENIHRPISEWATIINTLKQQLLSALKNHLPAEIVLSEFTAIDKAFTLAMGQIGRVADNRSQADMLDQMIMLKEQISMLEKNRKRFIHVAAHELKTPLTLLEGYAKMLREQIPADDLRTSLYLGGIDNGTNRLRSIINDMIDVSLISSGSFTITRQPLSLDSVLSRVLRGINREFKSRQVELEVLPMDKAHLILGDPERLVQAFFKLVGNGVKYTPDGGSVKIEAIPIMSRSKNDEHRPMIDVRISDTGVGISNQNLTKIFEPFTGDGAVNLHSSSKTKFMGGGPGLGLPIAKGVIEAHGGNLWCESDGYDHEACPGSIFHIELPILEAAH
ncbi:MAG: HAMP domain-containing sensor histidine kinase, partial [Chloroflexota bacterium]